MKLTIKLNYFTKKKGHARFQLKKELNACLISNSQLAVDISTLDLYIIIPYLIQLINFYTTFSYHLC